jgi:putative transcriptional regulator
MRRMAESVANCVYTLRAKSGMTQEELADKVGVSRQTVIAIEKGNYTPSVLLAMKIAKVFRTPVEEVFKITHEPR